MQLLECFLGRLRGDEEFSVYRADAKQIEMPFVLLPAPDSTRPSTETLEKIDHECSLRGELSPDRAARPLAFSERSVPITLVQKEPGGVPACVSAIVMKMDAKTPEERYQPVFGVENDLRRRVAKWEPHNFIADASPVHYAADCLLILERAHKLAIPLIAFGRMLGGGPLVLGSGYCGIGESGIVTESPKLLVPEFPHQQTQRRFHLRRDVPGHPEQALVPGSSAFSGEPPGARRLTFWSSEQYV